MLRFLPERSLLVCAGISVIPRISAAVIPLVRPAALPVIISLAGPGAGLARSLFALRESLFALGRPLCHIAVVRIAHKNNLLFLFLLFAPLWTF